jgi:hypothetical protein
LPGTVVFLGPSLPVDRALQILKADYRPPARRGDIYQAAESGASVICLIDGVFFQDCSVAHKEVLYALEKGCRVLGASSMGALRAAELDVYGMEGVGEIYMAYKRGDLVSDDEVALIFDPFTLQPLSEPLVNIRHNLRLACCQGMIDRNTEEALLKIASELYFPDRSYKEIMEKAKGQLPAREMQQLEAFLERERRDLKMEDAILVLRRAKEITEEIEDEG